jgi:transcriptional regulator with XRE-family HTH domain
MVLGDAELRVRLGAEVARLRKARGLSQVELARMVNLDSNTISRIERGRKGSSDKTRVALAEALQVELYELLGYTGVKAAS